MFTYIRELAVRILAPMQLSEKAVLAISESLSFISLFLVAVITFYLAWFILKRTLIALIHRSDNKYDDFLIKNKLFSRLSYLVPSYIISQFVSAALPSFPGVIHFVESAIEVYALFVVALVIDSLLTTANDIYNTFEMSKNKPIKVMVQVLKIILYLAVGLMIFATLAGQPLGTMLIGLGTISAVLMLIFKDPILGFVGGLQLSLNDMVRIGDWISMPKYGADGDVLEITLTTVKVQNWDRTITTIPTYALVTDSFQNWRGMEESGGRRIKRHINIDMESVKFCTPEMLENFKKFQLVSKYIDDKEKNIAAFNKANNIDTSSLVNGRRQTNLGIFRAYMKAYLMAHPLVHQELIMLVRQLQPTQTGIPFELYFFSNRQAWGEYEDLQSDVFDHVISVLPMFDLDIFQSPNNHSINRLAEALQAGVAHTDNLE